MTEEEKARQMRELFDRINPNRPMSLPATILFSGCMLVGLTAVIMSHHDEKARKTPQQKEAEAAGFSLVTIDGHQYLKATSSMYGASTLTHSESCPCRKK